MKACLGVSLAESPTAELEIEHMRGQVSHLCCNTLWQWPQEELQLPDFSLHKNQKIAPQGQLGLRLVALDMDTHHSIAHI